MHITTGQALTSRATWARLQFIWLAAGLALTVSASVMIGRSVESSSSGGKSDGTSLPSSVGYLALPEETTVYIVGSSEEASTIYSAANEGLGGPSTAIIAASPEDEAYVSLMAAESAHGVLQGVQIIDLRDR